MDAEFIMVNVGYTGVVIREDDPGSSEGEVIRHVFPELRRQLEVHPKQR